MVHPALQSHDMMYCKVKKSPHCNVVMNRHEIVNLVQKSKVGGNQYPSLCIQQAPREKQKENKNASSIQPKVSFKACRLPQIGQELLPNEGVVIERRD